MTSDLTKTIRKSVLKKPTPDEKLMLYLVHRDYCKEERIDGVVKINSEYVQHRKIFGQLIAHFRYGREKDEVMGLKFFRDFVLAVTQIYPPTKENEQTSHLQDALIQKLGSDIAFPFNFSFPDAAPPSVSLQSIEKNDNESNEPCGIYYYIKVFCASNETDIPRRRCTTIMNIRKVEYAPDIFSDNFPYVCIKRNFNICSGFIELETSVDKQFFEPEEEISVNICVQNNSSKIVKKISVTLCQSVRVNMLQKTQYKRILDYRTSRKICPILPGYNSQLILCVYPTLNGNRMIHGLALNGCRKEEDINLASSTSVLEENATYYFGFIVSYFIEVKLHLGALNGSVSAKLPISVFSPKL